MTAVSSLPYTTAFFLASAAITLAPGPDILYVLAKGVSQGRRSAWVAAAGFCSGLSIHTAASAFGLSALLVASAKAFAAVKFLGAGYLIYLGIRAILSSGFISAPPVGAPLSKGRIFGQAFIMNVLNPKVALFFLAFLPQFVRTGPGQAPVPQQLFLLGLGFAAVAFTLFSLVGFFSSFLGRSLRQHPAAARGLDRLAGTAFILLGVRLAIATRD